MKIREIIMWLSIMRNNLKDFPEVGSDSKIKALGEALVIIHKYEKIQEIVEHWACCGNPSDLMITISEVIDGGDKQRMS